jgi:hypothetical protein
MIWVRKTEASFSQTSHFMDLIGACSHATQVIRTAARTGYGRYSRPSTNALHSPAIHRVPPATADASQNCSEMSENPAVQRSRCLAADRRCRTCARVEIELCDRVMKNLLARLGAACLVRVNTVLEVLEDGEAAQEIVFDAVRSCLRAETSAAEQQHTGPDETKRHQRGRTDGFVIHESADEKLAGGREELQHAEQGKWKLASHRAKPSSGIVVMMPRPKMSSRSREEAVPQIEAPLCWLQRRYNGGQRNADDGFHGEARQRSERRATSCEAVERKSARQQQSDPRKAAHEHELHRHAACGGGDAELLQARQTLAEQKLPMSTLSSGLMK